MISELNKSEYYKCKALINEEGLLESKAVIEGENHGRIFVNDPIAPSSGFIWLGSNNGFIFIGNEDNEEFNLELNHFFNTIIKTDALKVDMTAFEAIGNHSKWNKTIKKVFGENVNGYNQRVYELQKDDYRKQNEPVIEQGYEVRKITKNILENKGHLTYENIGFLHSKLLEFWTSFERFLHYGHGYMVFYENEIVSVCFSGVVAGNVHGIDIETLEHHQGKKLAQKAAHSFVQDCIDNHITPYWDCMEINESSVSVAESIGFKNTFNYSWYSITFE
ncbi:GNAT family N-acetyltransferase [Rossellomorea sp. NS-SX7]|uniref:GNAT family N-acetyltransferase n=1 Tax=Rossellomorea sp. NS-SX7 TaxID=3463856 RepID=UPI004059107A